jgi:hypothetical protein
LGGQVLALDPLGNVLGGRVRDLVPEHRRQARVVLRHRQDQRQDPHEDDELAARQATASPFRLHRRLGIGPITDASRERRRKHRCRVGPPARGSRRPSEYLSPWTTIRR